MSAQVRFHRIRSLGGTKFTGSTGDLRELSLADFRASLVHEPTLDKYSVGSFCPADFSYPSADEEGLRRKIYVVGASDSVWLDVDKLAESEWETVLECVREKGWEAEAWSTWSYVPGGRISARMRVTVDRAHHTGAEVQAAREGLARELTAAVRPAAADGPRAGLIADPACFQPAAIFYAPSVHPERQGTEKTWFFDGSVRPKVDELAARAETSARELAKVRLLQSGAIVERSADEPATDADRAEAAAWFERKLAWVARPEELVGRKNHLFVFGSRVRATVAIGGLDADECTRKVEETLLSDHEDDVGVLLPHFVRGLQTGNQLDPVRAEESLIEEKTVEIQEEHLETRVWTAVERDLEASPLEAGDLSDARAALTPALRRATTFSPAAKRRLLVIQAPAGLGKTTGLAKAASENVRNGVWTALVAPNHDVTQEFVRALPEDVREKTVLLHSPLVEVQGDPFCELSAPERAVASRRVNDFGGMQHDICKACRLAETCEARKAWNARNRRAKTALLVVASYQNIDAVDQDPNRPRVLVVDEQPPVVETAEVTLEDLRSAKGLAVDSFDTLIKALERGTALPSEVASYTPTIHSSVSEQVEAQERAVAKLRKYHSLALLPGATVFRRGDGSRVASAPSAVMRRLWEGSGTIMSATPAVDVLGAAEVVRLDVAKHASHVRVMYPRADVARQGEKKLARRLVEEAGHRAALEAGAGEALLVTYLSLAEELEKEWTARPSNLRIAYYGNVRGRNDWEKCSAVICVGTPWDRHLEEARALGLDEGSEDAWAYARARASAELRQAVERVRSVSRPGERVWMGVVGNVAPWGWSTDTTEVREWGEEARTAAKVAGAEALAERRRGGWTLRLLSLALGVGVSQLESWSKGAKPVPSKHLAALLALPEAPFSKR